MLAPALRAALVAAVGPPLRSWDAVVAGAGPGGALAALELARGGASVLLIDRAAFPRWKVCGACLSPGSLGVLDSAGLAGLVAGLGGVPLRRLVLSARGRAAPVPLTGSMALSRSALDGALVGAAQDAGAVFWPESRVALGGTVREGRRVRVVGRSGSHQVQTRVVIDATGLGHGLRGGASPPDEVASGSRVGLGAVFAGVGYPVERGDLHMAVGEAGYVGLVRVEDGTLNVGAAVDPERLRGRASGALASEVLLEAGLPPLEEEPILGWRGTPLLTRSSSEVGDTRLFRVGDATGYVEPFTGEGICWALSAGRFVSQLAGAAAELWSDELLETWRAYRRRSLDPSQRLCRALARGLRRPWMVGAGVAALRVAPRLAAPFVAMASRPPAEVGA